MSNSQALSTAQEQILLQFRAVTSNDDCENAVALLSQNNWEIEKAISEFLDGEEHRNNSYYETSSSRNRSDITESLSSSITTVVTFPVTLVWGVLGGLMTLLYSSLVPLDETSTQDEIGNSRIVALEFIQEFEENYGGARPEFFVGGYSEALSRAKQEAKYLLVVLLTDGPEVNRTFCRNTLASVKLVEFLREHRIIVWGGNTSESEAYQVSKTLQATAFPFVGLLGFQFVSDNSPSLSLIDKLQGPVTPEMILHMLTDQLHRTSTELQFVQREYQEREASRIIREQQDEAYRLSLLADQEKERQAEEKRRQRERERVEAEESEKARSKFEADRLRYRQYLATTIPKEPSSDEPNTARLSFKMANGAKVIRRFRGDEKVEDVYAFIDTLGVAVDGIETDNPVPEYKHRYTFHLVSPPPRAVIKLECQDQTIRDNSRLWPSANLLVEEIEGSEY
ncbi:UBX-domain-containing protein [Basidiobolus meristosporus CBS 931.73]|uniref:UBX-domain-containing protein n=1 Tax=Basidiobolus meristosporus CBS 931.73 TaxID=1314790 RepID=A0A1Y1YN62_9FUNG|nr:UBX-domain-containing protein [Basidiobolus meristosporus CBS 931.73]|eukprot:ORX99014.1 UBX-domain-containing protein [Basidiobolus meristosporus CBS 931.73]